MPKKKVTEAVEEVVQEPVVSEHVPPQAPRRQGSDDLLELNDLERGVTREDSEDAKWGYLAASSAAALFRPRMVFLFARLILKASAS